MHWFRTIDRIPVLPVRNHGANTINNAVGSVETPASPVGTSTPASPVETTPPDDSEMGGCINSETDTSDKQPVIGTLVMKTVGIVKLKKKRKARCKLCGISCNNVKELNQHHKDTHDIVFCPDCNKAFSTCTSLDEHVYVHKDLDYVCDQCGQSYPFESRLKQHKMTHHGVATHRCMVKSCAWSFENTGDLNRHVNQHTSIWYKCDFCTYQNKDKRNTESHQCIHISGNKNIAAFTAVRSLNLTHSTGDI